MPRNPNQTPFDNMMTKFKQRSEPRARRASHASLPSHMADPRSIQTPRSHTPHPPHNSARAVEAYPVCAGQAPPTAGGVSPRAWDEPVGTGAPTYGGGSSESHYEDYPYGTMPTYDPSSNAMSSPNVSQMMYAPSSQWIVVFKLDGQNQRQYPLPVERCQVPQALCPCGTVVRIVHLPSIVGWTPPFNVLWNFKKNNSNAWIEGTAPLTTCVSATKCPSCKAQITLHGPTTSSAQHV